MKKAVFALVLVGSTALAYIDKTQAPMSRERLVSILTSHPEVTTLDQVPAILPEDFRTNFVLKHGLKRNGERGHLFEKKVRSHLTLSPHARFFSMNERVFQFRITEEKPVKPPATASTS